jgi:hypothetical protein
MTRQLCAVAIAGSILLGWEPSSLADDTKKARAAYKKGSALFVEGKFVAAIEVFEEAYRLSPNFRVQCSIALCYQGLGNAVEAAQRYRRCLREGGEKSKFGNELKASLAKMEKLVVHVEVNSPGEGGTVYLDGERQGRAPRQLAVNPGSHVIEVRRRQARAARATIKVAGGETKVLELVPVPEAQVQVPVPETPRPPSRRRVPSYWFWAGAGLSVALATVAIVLGVQTWNLREDYMSNPSPDSYNTFLDRRLLTNIFAFTAGAVAAGSTVLFFFTDFSGRSKERPASKQGSMLGVGLQGTF